MMNDDIGWDNNCHFKHMRYLLCQGFQLGSEMVSPTSFKDVWIEETGESK